MVLRKALAALMFGAVTLIGAGDASAQRKGGDVIIAIVQAPPSIDAHVTSAQAARNITLHIFETSTPATRTQNRSRSSPKA